MALAALEDHVLAKTIGSKPHTLRLMHARRLSLGGITPSSARASSARGVASPRPVAPSGACTERVTPTLHQTLCGSSLFAYVNAELHGSLLRHVSCERL